jgi:hypothetical protein
MKKGIILKLSVCLSVFSLCLFSYLEKQNELTQLRLYAPKLVKEIKCINEENTRLKYEIEQFESPDHLMMLARDTRFSHLKHPLNKDVIMLLEGYAVEYLQSRSEQSISSKPKVTLAVGAK